MNNFIRTGRGIACSKQAAHYVNLINAQPTCTESKTYSLRELLTIKTLIVIAIVFYMFSLSAQTPRKDSGANGLLKVSGTVVSDSDGKPIQGVSVRIADEKGRASTKSDGSFSMPVLASTGTIKFSHVGYKPLALLYAAGVSLTVKLIPLENQLEEVEVVSTGYQKIPKERATGSFEFVDNKLFNRKVSTDFISRLEDVVPSVSSIKIFDDNRGVLPNINIRGRSTIQSKVWPLIVLDGVPYEGDFNSINPNDVENVTLLKDAAASSIWGAQSGNGVIVVTTKRAGYEKPVRITFNSNVTLTQKPDLYYQPQMSTSDFIAVERMLFDQGFFDGRMYDINYNITPVVQWLKRHKEGNISSAELEAEMERLQKIDMRDDFTKYIYRNALKQQYNVQIEGGGKLINSLFSLGYDRNKNGLVTSGNDRVSLRSSTSYRPLPNLDINLSTQYTEYNTKESLIPIGYNALGAGYGNYPYMELADANGNPLIVDAIGLNPIFRDTVAGGRLLDWKYRPLAELNETAVTSRMREMMLSFNARYKVLPSLNLSLLYNYRNANTLQDNWRGMGSVFQRAEINYFAVWDQNSVKWNIPVGDYLYRLNRQNVSQQGRIQADFNKKFDDVHELNVLAGAEVRQQKEGSYSATFWGYDPESLIAQPMDYVNQYPYLNGRFGKRRIRDNTVSSHLINRYTSFFVNGSYTYRERYMLNASARKDASNLFGVKTNDKGKPFWSLGVGWIMSNEPFVGKELFSLLKLRATYGHNGNVNNTSSAYPIIYRATETHFLTGLPYATMQSPPNPTLRWETVGMLNLGLDFQLASNRLNGSVEYYVKKPKDLISDTQLDPTTGFGSLYINSANLLGRGLDIGLHSVNILHNSWDWKSDLVFAYSRTKVTQSYVSSPIGQYFLAGAYGLMTTPIKDADLNSVYAYKWAGLDPETGMPRGYIDGEVSTNYSQIYYDTPVEQMDNHGSALPIVFGSLRNSFRYKDFDFSFNISYQLGHKFMRKSVNYTELISDHIGHPDYAKRWQKPGDELHTDVPVFKYPANYFASYFYNFSSALVEPADQVKLRDIQLGYYPKLPARYGLKDLRLYAYINNICTLWRANKLGIDPEFGSSSPDPLACSLGVSFKF